MNAQTPITIMPGTYETAHQVFADDRNLLSEEYTYPLELFRPHTLASQSAGGKALMDRVDTKYLLPIHLLPEFLLQLNTDYSALQIGDHRIFTYETTYFDTPNRQFFRMHHNGKLNRHKVRYRHYVETATSFLEIKAKCNKKRTTKTRIPLDQAKPIQADISQFLHKHLGNRYPALETSLFVNYRRISLLNQGTAERLTLDFDLLFKRSGDEHAIELPKVFITELKQYRKNNNSPFLKFIKAHRSSPVSFSKYCIGNCLTDDGNLKTNRFKPTLSTIQTMR